MEFADARMAASTCEQKLKDVVSAGVRTLDDKDVVAPDGLPKTRLHFAIFKTTELEFPELRAIGFCDLRRYGL